MNYRIIFFGSTDDSVIILKKLLEIRDTRYEIRIVGCVTQPPRPIGRSQTIIPTPVEVFAKIQKIPVYSFPSDPARPLFYLDEHAVTAALTPLKPDLIVAACYGQKIPLELIKNSTFGGLNIHPSALPKWRGADPVPWAILSGDMEVGVTVVGLSEELDQGQIYAQEKVSITDKDRSGPLRTKLFVIGGKLLVELLLTRSFPQLMRSNCGNAALAKPMRISPAFYARRLTRDDGFIPWELIESAINPITVEIASSPDKRRDSRNDNLTTIVKANMEELVKGKTTMAQTIERAVRALNPWPGVWTIIKLKTEDKRLKILACHLDIQPGHEPSVASRLIIDTVQLEGKNPVPFIQFAKAYLDGFE